MREDSLPETLSGDVLRNPFPELVIYTCDDKLVLHSKEKTGPILLFQITLSFDGILVCAYNRIEHLYFSFSGWPAHQKMVSAGSLC